MCYLEKFSVTYTIPVVIWKCSVVTCGLIGFVLTSKGCFIFSRLASVWLEFDIRLHARWVTVALCVHL